jgi:hypothetical protein
MTLNSELILSFATDCIPLCRVLGSNSHMNLPHWAVQRCCHHIDRYTIAHALAKTGGWQPVERPIHGFGSPSYDRMTDSQLNLLRGCQNRL